jgi:hypothetical protein
MAGAHRQVCPGSGALDGGQQQGGKDGDDGDDDEELDQGEAFGVQGESSSYPSGEVKAAPGVFAPGCCC